MELVFEARGLLPEPCLFLHMDQACQLLSGTRMGIIQLSLGSGAPLGPAAGRCSCIWDNGPPVPNSGRRPSLTVTSAEAAVGGQGMSAVWLSPSPGQRLCRGPLQALWTELGRF